MIEQPAYGLWSLVIINSVIVIFFAFSFAKPRSKRDWRSFGAFTAFIVALFTEMYGIPLTIYLLSGWLQNIFPGVDFLAHDNGHLWSSLLGFDGDPHLNPIHIASNFLLLAGFLILASAWKVLYKAQKKHQLAKTGLYAWVRHPQYVAFIMILFAFLLMWPTILTITMFPILVIMYIRLAKKEEKTAREEFGLFYYDYEDITPAFLPSLKRLSFHKIQSLILLIGMFLIVVSMPISIQLIALLLFPILVKILTKIRMRKEIQTHDMMDQ